MTEKQGRCHCCDRYFEMQESPDGGTTCSKKCSNEYTSYLMEGINEKRKYNIC